MKSLLMVLLGILISQSLLAQIGRPIGKNDGEKVENEDLIDLVFNQVYLNVGVNVTKCSPGASAFTHQTGSIDLRFAEVYNALMKSAELSEKQKFELVACLVGDTTTFKKFTHHEDLEEFLRDAAKLDDTKTKEAISFLKKISGRKLKKGLIVAPGNVGSTKEENAN